MVEEYLFFTVSAEQGDIWCIQRATLWTIETAAALNSAASGDLHSANFSPLPFLLFNGLSFISMSLWLPPLHTLHPFINLSRSMPFLSPPFFSHLLPVTPKLSLSPSSTYPFLTSLSTLVTYFMSGCPENTSRRSQLFSHPPCPCLLGTLIRK